MKDLCKAAICAVCGKLITPPTPIDLMNHSISHTSAWTKAVLIQRVKNIFVLIVSNEAAPEIPKPDWQAITPESAKY